MFLKVSPVHDGQPDMVVECLILTYVINERDQKLDVTIEGRFDQFHVAQTLNLEFDGHTFRGYDLVNKITEKRRKHVSHFGQTPDMYETSTDLTFRKVAQ